MRISALEDDTNVHKDLIMELKSENEKLKNKSQALQHDLNFLEQLALQNTLEIHGVPQKSNKNLISICCEISKALGVNLAISDISNVYRLIRKNTSNQSTKPLPIILKLSHQMVRDAILNNRKLKSHFNTIHIGWPAIEKHPIYIRESLSLMNRRIYSAAFDLKKNGKIKFLWIAGGKIYYRREEGTLRLQLFNLENVEKLI